MSRTIQHKQFYLNPGVWNEATKDRDADTACHFEVRVMRDQASLVTMKVKLSGDNNRNDSKDKFMQAIVMPRRVICSTNTIRKFFLGYALFHEKLITSEIIAHESVHIALHYLRRLRYPLCFRKEIDEREERMAYTIGLCVQHLVHHLRRLEVY